MNNAPCPTLQFLAIVSFAVLAPQLATASDLNAGTSLKMAMGPMSAAQKNQGTTAKSDDVATSPHHRTTHRHKHRT